MLTEIHEHYDNEDRRTGYTVVTRESPWDDDSRDRALALGKYESGICGCGCGQPVAIAYDKSQAFIVDKVTCYAGRALERVRRQQREAADKANRPDGWDDGLHHYVAPHDDDDDNDHHQKRDRGET